MVSPEARRRPIRKCTLAGEAVLMPDPDLSDFNDVLMRQDGWHVINDHRQNRNVSPEARRRPIRKCTLAARPS
jgi:hypothetical protein